MIAVDTNSLVYAFNTSSGHGRAVAAMERLVDEPAWGLPWIVAGEFYSVLTDARLWREPQIDAALDALNASMRPRRATASRAAGLRPRLRSLLAGARPLGPKVHDGGSRRCASRPASASWGTARPDFSWYPQLKVRNVVV